MSHPATPARAGMPRATKLAIVIGGYCAAAFAASLALQAWLAFGASPDRDTSGGMAAFGDLVFFVAAFALAAVPATLAALFFLRPLARFWKSLMALAAVFCMVSLAALAAYTQFARSPDGGWLVMLSPLWLLACPLFGGAFAMSGLLAPMRAARITLMGSATVHFAVVLWFWLVGLH